MPQIWVNFSFCIVTLVESCLVIHIVYRGVGVVQEGLGEFIDGWARVLIPGAYVICISTVMSMKMDDGYEDDGMAPMFSAMGEPGEGKYPKFTFLPEVVIAPILVVLWIALFIAYKGGKNAFRMRRNTGVDGATLDEQSTVRKSLHMLAEVKRAGKLLQAAAQVEGSGSLRQRSGGLVQSVAITGDDPTAADVTHVTIS